jgi:5S rRNA maturation endonuclease (ribonuclease M5)
LKKKDYVELFERLNKLIEDINNLGAKGYIVIVEGKKDRAALEGIGLRIPILLYNEPGFHNKIIEREIRGVIILTDWDKEGKELNRKISDELRNLGIRVDQYYRNKFREVTRYLGDTVEGLDNKLISIFRRFS